MSCVNSSNKNCSLYKYLRHTNFPDSSVQAVMGISRVKEQYRTRYHEGSDSSPYAVKNLLGWTITVSRNQKTIEPKDGFKG